MKIALTVGGVVFALLAWFVAAERRAHEQIKRVGYHARRAQ